MTNFKVFSAGAFTEYLKKPTINVLKTFKFEGHYSKFDFTNTPGSHIIIAKFTSNGIRSEIYKSHIEGMLAYLNYSFDVVGELVDRKNNSYELIFNKGATKIIVRFYYISKIITTDFEDETNTNRGQKYEREMINKMNALGYTTQTKPEESESKSDIELTINGVTARIELKTTGAEYGSGTLEWIGNSWRLKLTKKTNPVLKTILEGNRILYRLTGDWVVYGYDPPSKATKEAQSILGERTYYISPEKIREYYKEKCDYLNFEGKGLFRVSERDPFNLGVPLFTPTTSAARARVQSKKDEEGPFAYRISLTATGLNSSFLSLDNDLNFLKNINI